MNDNQEAEAKAKPAAVVLHFHINVELRLTEENIKELHEVLAAAKAAPIAIATKNQKWESQ